MCNMCFCVARARPLYTKSNTHQHTPNTPTRKKTVYASIRLCRRRRAPDGGGAPYLLVWHKPALLLAALAIACYLTTIAAKEDAALQTLFLLQKVGRGFLFPFVRPALDTVGLFMLLTVASIVYGACKQEPESFKWAAFTAYVHVLLSYPIVIANFQVS